MHIDDEELNGILREACGIETPPPAPPPSPVNEMASRAIEVWELFLARGGRIEDLMDRK